jgi:hypothetical protein
MPADFKILGELEQLLFILSHHEELGFGGVLGDDPYDFLAEVRRIFNLATEELVEPSDLEDWCWINFENCGEDGEKWREWSLIASAYDRYLSIFSTSCSIFEILSTSNSRLRTSASNSPIFLPLIRFRSVVYMVFMAQIMQS